MKNILLICGSGASSGFMAQSIRKAAKKRGLELNVNARSDSELDEYLPDIDVLLIGPHFRFIEPEVKEKAAPYGVPVEVLDQSIYGVLDGDKALDLVLTMLKHA